MDAIFLAIAACIGWGIADFIGGLKSRSLPTLSILMVSTLSGGGMLAAGVWILNIPFSGDPSLFWAIPAACLGILSLSLLYKSLAVGNMAILAPISATGVILPVIWGLAMGETLSGYQLLGICLAISGTAMAAMERGSLEKKWTRGIGLAMGAALFIGLYFIVMDRAASHDPVWATLIMRAAFVLFLIPVLVKTRTQAVVPKQDLPAVLSMGIVDTLAAAAFAVATTRGMLSEVSVVSSLYPAVTACLSWLVVREPIQRIQLFGIIFSLCGIMLISGD